MAERKPEWALVTGAASGIGRCVAQECAARGMKLVLVDINAEGLEATAAQIREAHDVAVRCFVQNLALPEGAENCLAFCDDAHIEIDFLANIAGIFTFGPLIDIDAARTDLMLDLHVKTVTRMSVLFGQRMKKRRFGYIFNMSSMSAWMPMPGIATYNASKSYVRSMSRSLRIELLPWNVSVTAICPGGVATPLLPIADKYKQLGVRLGILMTPEKLARKAVKATLKRKNQTIPGFMNKLFTLCILLLPDWLTTFIMKRVPMYDRFWKPELQADGGEVRAPGLAGEAVPEAGSAVAESDDAAVPEDGLLAGDSADGLK